jgi:ribonuclease HI
VSKLRIFSDGASRGNPGASGIGVVISDAKGDIVREISEYIGRTTNNVAEYSALIRALEEASELGAKELEIHTDSELLARQVTGVYRIRAAHLMPLAEKVRALMGRFQRVSITHVMREENHLADKLARKGSNAASEG